jgi:NAD(P)-dependent dehydrogenase (short-subunit alcohol dehydrogenase family)
MQRILITAGASGIGKELANAFIQRGDLVAIVDVDPSAVDKFAEQFPNAKCFCASVTDQQQMQVVFNTLDKDWPSIDVIMANAGIAGPAGPIESLELDEWKRCLDVNLDGAFITAKWAAKRFKAQQSGLLILTSSTAGLFGYPYRSPYAVAKWGVIGLMKTLAMELGEHNVRVNALCPGAVEGERMQQVITNEAKAKNLDEAQVKQFYVRGVSMRTWVKAQDIANMALFLASDAGNKISGQALSIDGHTETLAP